MVRGGSRCVVSTLQDKVASGARRRGQDSRLAEKRLLVDARQPALELRLGRVLDVFSAVDLILEIEHGSVLGHGERGRKNGCGVRERGSGDVPLDRATRGKIYVCSYR